MATRIPSLTMPGLTTIGRQATRSRSRRFCTDFFLRGEAPLRVMRGALRTGQSMIASAVPPSEL